MIAGPNVYICDGCVEQAARQLAPRQLATRQRPPDGVRCPFCRQLRAKDVVTAVGSLTLCADCLGVIKAILGEAAQSSRP